MACLSSTSSEGLALPISFQPASPSLLRPLPPPLSFSLSLWSSAREHRGPWFARAEARGGERPGERRRSKQEDEVEVEVEESQSQARAKAFQISREKKRPSKGALRWSQEHCTTLVPTPSVTSAISSRRASGQKQSLASQSIRQRGESRRNKKTGERGRKRAKSRCATISFPSLRPLLLLLALQLQSLELGFIESGQIKGGRERHEKKPGREARQGRRRQGCCFSRRALSPHCSTPFLSLSLRSLSLSLRQCKKLTCSGPRESWCAWTWACAWARPSRRAGGRLLRASPSEPGRQQQQQRPKSAARRWTSALPRASGAPPGPPRSRFPQAPRRPPPSRRAWPWFGVLSLARSLTGERGTESFFSSC